MADDVVFPPTPKGYTELSSLIERLGFMEIKRSMTIMDMLWGHVNEFRVDAEDAEKLFDSHVESKCSQCLQQSTKTITGFAQELYDSLSKGTKRFYTLDMCHQAVVYRMLVNPLKGFFSRVYDQAYIREKIVILWMYNRTISRKR